MSTPTTTPPADPVDPTVPAGWTAEAWAALRGSCANKAALRAYTLADDLLQIITGYLAGHTKGDRKLLEDLCVPIPPAVQAGEARRYTEMVAHHFRGFRHALRQFLEEIDEVIPDIVPADAEDEAGEADEAPPKKGRAYDDWGRRAWEVTHAACDALHLAQGFVDDFARFRTDEDMKDTYRDVAGIVWPLDMFQSVMRGQLPLWWEKETRAEWEGGGS